jgi:hypothetical protein
MKQSVLQKVIFLLIMAISIVSFGSVSAETVADYGSPDFSAMITAGSPVLAMGALAIPVCNLENLKCVTMEAFAGLQAKFGKLYVIDVEVDEVENYQFLIRRPTRQHLEIIENFKNDTTKINDFFIKNLVVAGNENNVLDDGVVFAQLNAQAAKIIRQGQGFLSKA